MVSKGPSISNSRIFHKCYIKLCQLQNLNPLPCLTPSQNGRALNFCVDRIKYQDWAPILNALSCDLSLRSLCVKCRNPVKRVLENIDCERLAKTIKKCPVILTKFLLNNLIEALVQMLHDTALLYSLRLEGLPLKTPYLNQIREVLPVNNSLQHLHLPGSRIGDSGCLALCKSVQCLPNLLTLDLTDCNLTPLGAGYIADLVKYQKIHRYSENWLNTLRYRMPELDTMAGLRRITVCSNSSLGDNGVGKLLEMLADDLWIKALDVQSCCLTEKSALTALQIMNTNTTLIILDLRRNADICTKSLSEIRSVLRKNIRSNDQYAWLPSGPISRSVKKSVPVKNLSMRNEPSKYPIRNKDVQTQKGYVHMLEEQLRNEISHRQQLEELNAQLAEQMRELKKQQMMIWMQNHSSSSSEQSIQEQSVQAVYDFFSGSSTSSSVQMDYTTLSYIQQAFKDIYKFMKDNQCQGKCLGKVNEIKYPIIEELTEKHEDTNPSRHLKNDQNTHLKFVKKTRKRVAKSAHDIRNNKNADVFLQSCKGMLERQIGDTLNNYTTRSGPEDSKYLDESIAEAQKITLLNSDTPSCSNSSIESSIGQSDAGILCSLNALQLSSEDDYDDD